MSKEVRDSKESKDAELSESAKLLKQLHDEILRNLKPADEMAVKMSLKASA